MRLMKGKRERKLNFSWDFLFVKFSVFLLFKDVTAGVLIFWNYLLGFRRSVSVLQVFMDWLPKNKFNSHSNSNVCFALKFKMQSCAERFICRYLVKEVKHLSFSWIIPVNSLYDWFFISSPQLKRYLPRSIFKVDSYYHWHSW